jgi:hypothetical protein
MTKINTLKYKEENEYLQKILSMKNADIEKAEETYRKQRFRIIGGLTIALISFINRNNWFVPAWRGYGVSVKIPLISEKQSILILSIITSIILGGLTALGPDFLISIFKSIFGGNTINIYTPFRDSDKPDATRIDTSSFTIEEDNKSILILEYDNKTLYKNKDLTETDTWSEADLANFDLTEDNSYILNKTAVNSLDKLLNVSKNKLALTKGGGVTEVIVLTGDKKILEDYQKNDGKFVLYSEYKSNPINITINNDDGSKFTLEHTTKKIYRKMKLSDYGGKEGVWVLLENGVGEIDNNGIMGNVLTGIKVQEKSNDDISQYFYEKKYFLTGDETVSWEFPKKNEDESYTYESPTNKTYLFNTSNKDKDGNPIITGTIIEQWKFSGDTENDEESSTIASTAFPVDLLLVSFVIKFFISLSITVLPLIGKIEIKWPFLGGKKSILWKGGLKFMKMRGGIDGTDQVVVSDGVSRDLQSGLGVLSNSRTIIITLVTMVLLFSNSMIIQLYLSSLLGKYKLGFVGKLIKRLKEGISVEYKQKDKQEYPGLDSYNE